MAWTAPMTATAGRLDAAEWNTHVRDNLAETMPAKATTAGGYFVGTGPNTLAQRTIGSLYYPGTFNTSSTSFVTFGSQIVVHTGTEATILVQAEISNNVNNARSLVGVRRGVTSPDTKDCIDIDGISSGVRFSASAIRRVTGLTPGANSFFAMARVDGSSTVTVHNMHFVVISS